MHVSGRMVPMALTTGERIDIITQCSTLLNAVEWSKLDLILTQHGFHTWPDWQEPTLGDYVMTVIRDAKDTELERLHSYLLSRADSVAVGVSPFKSDKVRLFLSHLSAHREFVGNVGRVLEAHGIDGFVAHDSIEISREWQLVIEGGLSDCDAMIVFLHEGFGQSVWCDQELGWVMGRKRPVMILGFNQMPHGFAGKYQALPAQGLTASTVALNIVSWVVAQKTLHTRLAESFTSAFVGSGSFNTTRTLIPHLESVDSFTDDQLARIQEAAKSNSQVREASYEFQPATKWVAEFVAQRQSSGTSGWTDSDPF